MQMKLYERKNYNNSKHDAQLNLEAGKAAA